MEFWVLFIDASASTEPPPLILPSLCFMLLSLSALTLSISLQRTIFEEVYLDQVRCCSRPWKYTLTVTFGKRLRSDLVRLLSVAFSSLEECNPFPDSLCTMVPWIINVVTLCQLRSFLIRGRQTGPVVRVLLHVRRIRVRAQHPHLL